MSSGTTSEPEEEEENEQTQSSAVIPSRPKEGEEEGVVKVLKRLNSITQAYIRHTCTHAYTLCVYVCVCKYS